jgi:hypothetical protein
MSTLRRMSRAAFPEAWARVTRYRRLRRLTQQATRAKGRGDAKTMGRIAEILRRLEGANVLTQAAPAAAPAPTLFQKGVAGLKRLVRRGGDR